MPRVPLYIDDRLATVLRARVGGAAAGATQFRQLVDLLGTLPSEARGRQIDAAYVRLAELGAMLAPAERAAALDEPGLRLRSPRLLAQLARSEVPVATAAMRAAQLSEAQWIDLIPALPVQSRGLVRHRRDLGPRAEALLARLGITDRGLPPAGEARQVPANDVQSLPLAAAGQNPEDIGQPEAIGQPENIGAIVQRIEAFRRRKAESAAHATPAPQAAQAPFAAFAFVSDENGLIDWAESFAAPAAVGLKIASSDRPGAAASAPASAPALADAHRRHQPIRAGRITLMGGPAIAGEWQVDAAPQFDGRGSFLGYQGRFRRPAAPPAGSERSARDHEADLVRQLLHELRTPVNAIQGFAEVIQQQLFGPTPHQYRAHAAAIAGDAARLLAGFDELERLAKLDSGAMVLDAGHCDLSAIVTATAAQLEAHTAQRGSGFSLEAETGPFAVGIDQHEGERLVWRLLATLAGAAAPGEVLTVRLGRNQGAVRLSLLLPEALAQQEDVFRTAPPAAPSVLSAGMFGAGFALRLAATEARSAGGSLERKADTLRLELPEAAHGLPPECLTDDEASNTKRKGLAG